MTCPNDLDLIAHADSADPEIAAHVACCASCREVLAVHALLVAAVRNDALYSPPAPLAAKAVSLMDDRPAVVAFADGLLDGIAGKVRDLSADFQQQFQIVAKVVFDSWGQMADGFEGVRGNPGARMLELEVPGAEISLQLTPPAAQAKDWTLMGQLSSADKALRSVELVAPDGTTVSTTADATGMFKTTLASGDWDVIMHTSDFVFVLPKLPVKPMAAGPQVGLHAD